ncbi:Rqc2 family fibronectin-binding protein [Jingyaoa shaoxingensis]|uniref:Rqc2 homolog RqcH n=1 Tax=Jingyaoa shaoxingensis TaxID=2763671 RepID=A0ABR7N8A5_9FIRM|nr:NFACT RNA binding domain-containing protein [Jingyaoa shaoxingensis]MBC8572395.1 NFACT family protein [Jingyaoa shaoxingensis]
MALDGLVIAGMVQELNTCILGGRISKIAQPESDELMFTIKSERRQQYRLLISAGASLPLIYFTEQNKPAPMTAPNFCMLLRKHIGGGKFTRIWQPGLERIINFEIEHLNELGDVCHKTLVVEIMGKHSNIIFCNEEGMIIDSIKHISSQISSVREVLPGRSYFIPETQEKLNPLNYKSSEFIAAVSSKPMPLAKSIYCSMTGISPLIAEEICHRASLDSGRSANSFSETELTHLEHQFDLVVDTVKSGQLAPNIVYEGQVPVDFSVVHLSQYDDFTEEKFDTVSGMLEHYYATRNVITRIRQRSADLRRIVQTALDRNRKKYDLQQKQLKDTEKREKFRIYGELINTYGYNLEEGAKKLTCLNYYDNKEITIPLDDTKSPQENAQHYFEKYNKLKRTWEASVKLTEETKGEIEHLESISTALDIARSEEDLVQIKEELTEYGYIRRHYTGKRVKITSRPFHYVSSDGYDIYVGKNNFQNEDLTFKTAVGNDWWFHAKGCPGSHVIVKTNGEELPDRTFEEAARLAAYYSKNREAEKAEVDYVERKFVKKVSGARPGFVIYHTNYSMLVPTDITGIQEVTK